MRRYTIIFYLFSITFTSVAQEVQFSKEEIYRSETEFEAAISSKYFRGKNLIYDCVKKHFACVIDANYEECDENRKEALENRKILLPCAPLKKLPTQIECFKLQYSLVHERTYKGFCISQKKLD